MEIRIFQKGFNYSQDGPGNRLVYHLQGCNLHGPWCANPEGLAIKGGTSYSVDFLVDEVKRSRLMFFDGGGVTLTGGEVCMQFAAVKEFLTRLHNEGIHTCIETNGTIPRLPELFDVLDLLIMDVKHYNPEKHQSVTGSSCQLVFENLKAALEAEQKIALRIPMIGGFNDSQEDAAGFAKLFTELNVGNRATLELLTYHEYGKSKYEELGMEYTMGPEARITKESLQFMTQTLADIGMNLIHT